MVECETDKKPLHQEGYRMAQYQITVDDEILEGLFQRDGGVAKLVESVVNQILQA
ncbi:IS256 family transposase, partial [Hydrogenibacillus schlegelii]